MTKLCKKQQCINKSNTHLNENKIMSEKVTDEVFELLLVTEGTVKIKFDELSLRETQKAL